MIRIKTLSLPLITALVASAVPTADAAVALALNSQKTYRQNKKAVDFKGGTFAIRLSDGYVSTIGFCNDPNYFPPGYYINLCSPGTSGFLSSGRIGGATIQRPYLVVTGLAGALVVEPKEAARVQLVAAPASTLARPSGGFTDDSAAVYYNLHTTDIREYGITNYYLNRNYTQNQRNKFESDIVPGAYRYSFPRLRNPEMPAVITAVIYPMAEGISEKNNQKVGVQFTQVNKNVWNKNGFVELSYSQPNKIKWSGITPNVAFAAADKLYFSLRALTNPGNPTGSDLVRTSAIFPAFQTNDDAASRILLSNPFIKQFITPPVLPSGTRAMVELELERDFQTGGVTYDFSTRRFQIPVIVIDRYDEYADIYLANAKKKKKDILADPDKDGYNNLTEWILGSSGSDAGSTPPEITVGEFQAVDITGQPTPFGSWIGFNVNVKRDTVPKVKYLLQRSIDQGKTWQPFVSEGTPTPDPFDPPIVAPEGWDVDTVTTIERGITSTQIQVRSKNFANNPPDYTEDNFYVQPPYSIGHLYRVKISLAKKKK